MEVISPVGSQNEGNLDPDPDDRTAELRKILPQEIIDLGCGFRLSPLTQLDLKTVNDRLRNLYWYLPPVEKATELYNLYYSRIAWLLVHVFNTTYSHIDPLRFHS